MEIENDLTESIGRSFARTAPSTRRTLPLLNISFVLEVASLRCINQKEYAISCHNATLEPLTKQFVPRDLLLDQNVCMASADWTKEVRSWQNIPEGTRCYWPVRGKAGVIVNIPLSTTKASMEASL